MSIKRSKIGILQLESKIAEMKISLGLFNRCEKIRGNQETLRLRLYQSDGKEGMKMNKEN